MVKNLLKNYIYPIIALVGGVVGVGFLSLPYITLQVGIWPMLFYFITLTGLMLFINLIFVKISLKTPDFKRFPGFVGFYLGKSAKKFTLAMVIFGSFGVLLAYLFVGASFLSNVLSPLIGEHFGFSLILYFAAASLMVYFGPKASAKLALWGMGLLLLVLVLVFAVGLPQIKLANIFISNADFTASNLFLPYGAILFSLWGTGMIPVAEEMLGHKKKMLKKIVAISTLLVAGLYLFFIVLILGISGGQTTESALTGLAHFLPPIVSLLTVAIGVITTFIAFIFQGIFLKEVFMYDMKVERFTAWVFTCFTPLVLFFLGFNSFISLISFVGGVLLGINGILILAMYKEIGGKNRVIYPLVVVFVIGIVYSIVYFVK